MSSRPLPALVAAAALLLGRLHGRRQRRPGPAAVVGLGPRRQQPTFSYVALGDSFTAAPGIPETDGSDGCLRSSRNYPSLVAEQLEATATSSSPTAAAAAPTPAASPASRRSAASRARPSSTRSTATPTW